MAIYTMTVKNFESHSVVFVEEQQTVHQKSYSPYALKEVKAQKLYKTTLADHSDDMFRIPKNYKSIYASGLRVREDASKQEQDLTKDIRDIFSVGVTQENYVRFFHNLLWFEETIVRINLKNYNMSGVPLVRRLDSYQVVPGRTEKLPIYSYALVVPGLAEKRPSLMLGDLLFVKPVEGDDFMFEAIITEMEDNVVNLKGFHKEFEKHFKVGHDQRFDVRFFMSRMPLERMHRAVQAAVQGSADQKRVFPVLNKKTPAPYKVQSFFNHLVEQNPEQHSAVEHIVGGTAGTAPYLLHGPPGTGKTVTIVEAILQVTSTITEPTTQRSGAHSGGTAGTAPYLLHGPPGTGKTLTIVEAILQVTSAITEPTTQHSGAHSGGTASTAPYLLHGPPGTGKTVTIVEAILQVTSTVTEPSAVGHIVGGPPAPRPTCCTARPAPARPSPSSRPYCSGAHSGGTAGTAPYLLHGPPGTGKTVTIVEAILQNPQHSAVGHIVGGTAGKSVTIVEAMLQVTSTITEPTTQRSGAHSGGNSWQVCHHRRGHAAGNLHNNRTQRSGAHSGGTAGTAPYLLHGPPGTGKTVTIVEAILQVTSTITEPTTQRSGAHSGGNSWQVCHHRRGHAAGNLHNNTTQRSGAHSGGTAGTAPYLLHGPPGTGKTLTIVEAILQLVKKNPANRIMVCTDSNMAADHVATMLIAYADKFGPKFLLRANSQFRVWETLPKCLYKFSNGSDRDSFFKLDIEEFMAYSIVVTTLSHAAKFAGQARRFLKERPITHLFIDEAAQASEPACLIPITGLLAGNGRLTLAGDPLQLGPVVISSQARKLGLGLSLMERLKNTSEVYASNDPNYTLMLRNNFRSDPAVLRIPNDLFYHGQLRVSIYIYVVNA
ncbi:AAA domain-containing protein [Phthorimaea operculella]|nr:AAA domain-containing protein [Phthorimaea operculella]